MALDVAQLLVNGKDEHHLKKINTLIAKADDIYVMVAFLKLSGINAILPTLNLGQKVQIIAGTNFGITEPKALSLLLDNMTDNDNISVFLNRLDSKQVFHPKMYLFKIGDIGHIIIGSANLTNGGLIENNECSMYVKCNITDPLWIDTYTYFQNCVSPTQADILSTRIIAIYRDFYNKQKKHNDQLDAFPNVSDSLFYDLQKLKSHFDKLDKTKIFSDIKAKKEHYKEALLVLEEIESKEHTDAQFIDLIEDLVGKAGTRGLWYSNGMFRRKEKIFKQQEKIRRLLNSIKNNLHKSPGKIYDEARKISREIYGLGPNYIGEIMMTYAPVKLANINRNPITVLREEGGVQLKSHSQSFNGADYQEYTSIVKEITYKLGLQNMLGADYFFNEIYQNLKQHKKSQLQA